MPQFIGKSIDIFLGPVLTAFVCYYLYKNPKATFFYKKKWVPIASVFYLIFGIFQYITAYQTFNNTRIPTANEFKKAIASDNNFVKEDMLYKSPDGYTIIIPAGYSYKAQSLGAVRLTANKGNSLLVLTKISSSDALEKGMRDIQNYLRSKNPTYTFSETAPLKVNNTEGLRVSFQVIKNNKPDSAILVLFKASDGVYSLMLACPKASFETTQAEYEKVINSFNYQGSMPYKEDTEKERKITEEATNKLPVNTLPPSAETVTEKNNIVDTSSLSDIKLSATTASGAPESRIAVINNAIYHIGDSVAGYKIDEIRDGCVVLIDGKGNKHEVNI